MTPPKQSKGPTPLLCCLFRGACSGGSHPCIRSAPPKGPLTRKFYGSVANVPQQTLHAAHLASR